MGAIFKKNHNALIVLFCAVTLILAGVSRNVPERSVAYGVALSASAVDWDDTQDFETVNKEIEPGSIHYQYISPSDSLERTVFPQEFLSVDQWQEGYTTQTFSFAAYTATEKWTYTVEKWKDVDGEAEYPAGGEIAECPYPYLQLQPVWKVTVSDRLVYVEYYNTLLNPNAPIETDNFSFSNGETYTVSGLSEEWFYNQSDGKRYHFENWITDSGERVEANARICLADFKYFPSGQYETLKLKAEWAVKKDPWGFEGKSFVIINDRLGSGGYHASKRYLAMAGERQDGNMGEAVVGYDEDGESCVIMEEVPEIWTFEPQENGTYHIRNGNGQYLCIHGANNVALEDEPEDIQILYNDTHKRYIFLNDKEQDSLLLTYESDTNRFSANKGNYAGAGENDDNGRKSRFLLATLQGAVSESDGEAMAASNAVKTDTFLIQQIDAGLDGKQDYPMPDVRFNVFEVTESGGKRQLQLSQEWDWGQGRYTVLYENGTPSDVALTDENGNICLTFPKPSPDSDIDEYQFEIAEEVPDGYLQGDMAPSFIVRVEESGNFAVDNLNEHGAIEIIKRINPGGGEEEAIVTGAKLSNQPKAVTISASKVWEPTGNAEDNVTFTLTGTVNGNISVKEAVILDAPSEWRHEWSDAFPMMTGNARVEYDVKETKIGAHPAGSESFNHWIQQYSAKFSDENHNEVVPNSFDYDKIDFTVHNVEKGTLNVSTTVVSPLALDSDTAYDFRIRLGSLDAENRFNVDTSISDTVFTQGVAIVSIQEGFPLEIELPCGLAYEVGEYAVEDMNTTVTDASGAHVGTISGKDGDKDMIYAVGTISPDTDAVLNFKNTRETGSLTVSKTVDSSPNEEKNTPSHFEATLTDNKSESMAAFMPADNPEIDVIFQKVDAFGNGIESTVTDAEFQLYTDEDCKFTADYIANNGRATYSGFGYFFFHTVPFGVYYMKETRPPEGFEKSDNTYLVLVGNAALEQAKNGEFPEFADVPLQNRQDMVENQRHQNRNDVAIFLLESGKAQAVPDIAHDGIMNNPEKKSRVILRKIGEDKDGNAFSLASDELNQIAFDILRYDKTVMNADRLTPAENGIFWVGNLPYGTYYLHEKNVPDDYAKLLGTHENWFEFTVDETGASKAVPLTEEEVSAKCLPTEP